MVRINQEELVRACQALGENSSCQNPGPGSSSLTRVFSSQAENLLNKCQISLASNCESISIENEIGAKSRCVLLLNPDIPWDFWDSLEFRGTKEELCTYKI